MGEVDSRLFLVPGQHPDHDAGFFQLGNGQLHLILKSRHESKNLRQISLSMLNQYAARHRPIKENQSFCKFMKDKFKGGKIEIIEMTKISPPNRIRT